MLDIDLNADLGETALENDAALMPYISSANIACGFHAGDPVTMREVVLRAKEEGVSLGAHPGFNDLWGFGRRQIDMRPDELEYMIAYQLGAMQAMATYAGLPVTHLKPHGALNNMAAVRADYALAIGRAIKTVDASVIYVALSGSEMEKAGRELGLRVAREGFCDRQYDDEGNLVSRKLSGAVLKDPAAVADQVVRLVLKGEIVSRNGEVIEHRADTLCIHGDEPSAIAVARAAREALERVGVKIVPLPELALA